MKVIFNNPEHTDITLISGVWWWKRVAKVKKLSFTERFDHKTRYTDPVVYRYVGNGDPVPQHIITRIWAEEYNLDEPARKANKKRRFEENWRKP